MNDVPFKEQVVSAEAVTQARRARWNPLRALTPQSLANALDAFAGGDIRQAAILWEVIAERDDTIPSVKRKRETDASLREVQVIAMDKSAEAKQHENVLSDFWRNVEVTDAYDRNTRGKRRLLLRQMMEAVSFRYSVHHIVWRVVNGQLRATFERVPLQFFENLTGRLRFCADGMSMYGAPLDNNWLIHTGDGLMIAASIAYLLKRMTLQDWVAFSEKFSMPGVIGRTAAAQNSPEGKAMKAAVAAFGNDWAAVVYGDTGTAKIEFVQANGNPSAMPMPALIERVDRKIAALYRGADLSTMSAGSGRGQGASLQEEEKDILLADDCAALSESLQSIDRIVIAWHFGQDVEPLAQTTVIPPTTADMKFLLQASGELADRGAKVSEASIMRRLGIEGVDASDPEDVPLGKMQGASSRAIPDIAANAAAPGEDTKTRDTESRSNLLAAASQMISAARVDEMAPEAYELRRIFLLQDPDAMREALQSWMDKLPDVIVRSKEMDAAWERILSAAFADGVDDANGQDAVAGNGAWDPNKHPKDPKGTPTGGRFALKTWMDYGLRPAAQIAAEAGNHPTNAVSAEARLLKGEVVASDAGEDVSFSRAILDHWRKEGPGKPKQEIRRRLMELDDAEDAVRNPMEVWEINTQDGKQRTYLRKYNGKGATRWMAVFVPEGTGRSYYSVDTDDKADNKFRKGRLVRRR